MPWLPVVDRELRVAARRPSTYRIRLVSGLVGVLIFAWFGFWIVVDVPVSTENQAQALFRSLTLCAAAFAVLLGLMATSDAISHEKREETLGFLFLTDLKTYDIVLGKMAAGSIHAFYALLSVFPILGIPLLMGGVALESFAQACLALLVLLIFSLSMGIVVSACNTVDRKAMVYTGVILFFFIAEPFFFTAWLGATRGGPTGDYWPWLVISPAYPVGLAIGIETRGPSGAYWYSLGSALTLSALAIAVASRQVRLAWRRIASGPKGPWFPRLRARFATINAPHRRSRARHLRKNPYLWLAIRGSRAPELAMLFLISIAAIYLESFRRYGDMMFEQGSILLIILITHLVFSVWCASEASMALIQQKRSGGLELILTTPLSSERVIRGHIQALGRAFGLPVVLLLAAEITISRYGVSSGSLSIWIQGNAARFLIEMFAIAWVTMWLSLNWNGVNRAILTALGLVVVLPRIAAWTTSRMFGIVDPQNLVLAECFSVLVSLALNGLFVFAWARPRLYRRLRTVAAQAT